jgi:hypothetical protein
VAKRTAKNKRSASEPYLDPDPAEPLEGANLVASEILADRRDLLPSVQLIMSAELDDDARMNAVELFRDSLDQIDDPNRDPRVAIDNAS